MDTNKNMARLSPTQGIGWILHETGLIDLHKYCQPQCPSRPTYNQGTTTIDTCLGPPPLSQALTAAWYLPFCSPITFPGDHCLLGMEFDMDILFSHKLPGPTTLQQCGVYSNTETTVKEFSKMVVDRFLQYILFDQNYTLAAKTQFNIADYAALESIDEHILW